VCLEVHRHCPACGADVSQVLSDDGDPYVGTTFAGKYHLVELIGVGAMGRVYRAEHLNLDAQVAVKVLNPELSADPQAAKRFHMEARAASRLRHPNTIQILDFGQAESGALFIAMEMLRGRTLARIIEGPPLGARRIADLLGQALLALDEAHAAGVVHRDFKPENIFVENLRTGREHVKVLDFGIAKLRGEAEAGLTSAGAVCGTPEYMSPEQIRGEELDARSDVYAAGIVLYEMLTGSRPFESNGPVIDILTAHLQRDPQPPTRRRPEAQILPSLEQICLKALRKNRDDRFRSADEMKQALELAARGASGEHCAQCGVALPGTARFCPQCGAVLRPSGSFAQVQASLAAPSSSAEARGQGGQTAELPSLPLPLVGREAVLERLEVLEHEAVLLIGEAGIGKSAVANEWIKREEARFRRTATVRAEPSGAQVPLAPIRGAVAQVLDLVRPQQRGPSSPRDVERAVRDNPEDRAGLLELFGFGGVASGLPLDARRRECMAAALATLRRAGASLLFEDAHLYDAPSRALLSSLAENPGDSTVLITASLPEVISAEIEVLRLGPLDQTAIDQLVAMGLPAGIGDVSGGVPFAVVEWLRARREKASEPTIEARLELLPEAARRLLEAAAVAGFEVRPEVLWEILGFSSSGKDQGRAIAELTLRGWVATRPELRGLMVASPTLRRRVEESMSIERRRELHAALAERLQALAEDPIVVAYHALHGGVGTAPLLEAAGDAARDAFDDDAAARWYRVAIDAGREAFATGQGDEGRQVRIALKLAKVQRYRGDYQQAEALLRDALALATRGQDRWAIVEARRALARVAIHLSQHAQARDHLVEAVGAALACGDRGLIADLYLELGASYGRLGDEEREHAELWEGVLLCTAGDGAAAEEGPENLWRLILRLGEISAARGELEEARRLGRHALRHAERVETAIGRARAHALLGQVHAALGQVTQAVEARRQATVEMRRMGDRRSTAEMLIALADPRLLPAGDARAWLREASTLSDQVAWIEGVQRSRAALAQLP
jgi:serine/threonine-protein kinase